jgi:MGT family glycosyltransferase
MATLVFFGEPGWGHTNPTLPLVAELVRRGERVIYYSVETFRESIERAGAVFRPYGETFPFDSSEVYTNQVKHFEQFLLASQLMLARLLPAIRQERPDAIVHDQLAVWGRFMAELLDVPAVSCMTMFAITPSMILADPAQIRNRLTSQSMLRHIRALADDISATYGVQRVGLFDMANNAGQLNIVFTSRAFQPGGSRFDETYQFVGPSLQPRTDEADFPFEALEPGKPLVYISLGTLFNDRPEFYRLCLAALESSPCQVVLAIGHRTAMQALGPVPGNAMVREYVPQLAVLERATLFISHAGMNSANEALYYGVPLLLAPQSADQPWVAQRVSHLGAGRLLRPRDMRPDRLRQRVEGLLADPSYARTSGRIGQTLREAGGYMRAADAIQRLLRQGVHYQAPRPSGWFEALFTRLAR